jgi:ketosteroid isomerase-like protein
MSTLVRIAVLVAVLLVLGLPGGISSSVSMAEPTLQEKGGEAVRENLNAAAAWDAAFNSENVDGVMALYADGAVSMPPGALPIIGKPAIRADYEFLFKNFDLRHRTTVVQLEVQGTMAVERGEYVMFGPNGVVVETGKHMIMRRRINGPWRVVIEIWNTH